jgi:hypothetical protein
MPIPVVAEHCLALVTSRDHVVDRALGLKPQRTSHHLTILEHTVDPRDHFQLKRQKV